MRSDTAEHRRNAWKRFFRILCLILAGTAVNLALALLASREGLPVYLESVGTILVTLICGVFPGVITACLSSRLYLFFLLEPIYYCAVHALTAVLAAFLHRRGWFRNWWKTLLSVPLFALVSGGLASLQTWLLYGPGFSGLSMPLAEKIYNAGLENVMMAQLSADIIYDLLDKLVCVGLAVLTCRLLPESFRDRFGYQARMRDQLSGEGLRKTERFRVQGVSLRMKIVLLVFFSIMAIAAVTARIGYTSYHDRSIELRIQSGQALADIVGSLIDPDKVDDYRVQGESAPGYDDTEKAMYKVLSDNPDIRYIYVYQVLEDGNYVVFDLDIPGEEGAEPGTEVFFDPEFRSLQEKMDAGEEVDADLAYTEDDVQGLLTVGTPVRNSEGLTVCYAFVDIDMASVRADEDNFLLRLLSLFVATSALLLTGALWYAEQGLILPINSIALASGEFAFNSEEERLEGAEKIRRLDIHTGDEIQNLYQAILKTTDDSISYIEETREKNAIITRMQENLIVTMADLVESRDQNTGDHIKKTAAYTRIIMDEMRKEGCYAEQLTDRFMADVFHSAPLHDIGKISVPDAVLNKPGRLTDEEFAQMKLHTVYGGQVLQKTRDSFMNISYLKVAKDLATYHHEWWNGKGYPEGLKGEEIPLSARIMAVADVFDALVSKRCYKAGMPFEKAMDIIREETGTHFDPQVAGAFLNAADEVRNVLDKQQKQG